MSYKNQLQSPFPQDSPIAAPGPETERDVVRSIAGFISDKPWSPPKEVTKKNGEKRLVRRMEAPRGLFAYKKETELRKQTFYDLGLQGNKREKDPDKGIYNDVWELNQWSDENGCFNEPSANGDIHKNCTIKKPQSYQ